MITGKVGRDRGGLGHIQPVRCCQPWDMHLATSKAAAVPFWSNRQEGLVGKTKREREDCEET